MATHSTGPRQIAFIVVLLGLGLACLELALPPRFVQACEQSVPPAQSQPSTTTQGNAAVAERPNPENSVSASPLSLGEVARKQRAEHAQKPSPPPRVFTNDNIPRASGGLSIIGPPAEQEPVTPNASATNETAARLPSKAADSRQQLEVHQRELSVLQQKLGENQVQWYPNPNDTLHQEYSRQDIDRLRAAIDEKKQQIEADQQAVSDAEDELARRGIRPSESGEKQAGVRSSSPDLSGVTKNSEQYWRLRFKAAREALKKAEEQEKLAEDELTLLKSQQAHEMASGNAASFEPQVSGKAAEVESKRAEVEQARQDMQSLEQEFERSGSPQAWSEPEAPSAP